ncbi:MAG: hypothetical protein RLY64_1061 [Bacteroidota bacterium]
MQIARFGANDTLGEFDFKKNKKFSKKEMVTRGLKKLKCYLSRFSNDFEK